MYNKRRGTQISVTLDDDFYERLKSACEIQEHAASQLARILVEWALPFYELTRSVKDLREYIAQDIVLRRGDSLQEVLDHAFRQQESLKSPARKQGAFDADRGRQTVDSGGV